MKFLVSRKWAAKLLQTYLNMSDHQNMRQEGYKIFHKFCTAFRVVRPKFHFRSFNSKFIFWPIIHLGVILWPVSLSKLLMTSDCISVSISLNVICQLNAIACSLFDGRTGAEEPFHRDLRVFRDLSWEESLYLVGSNWTVCLRWILGNMIVISLQEFPIL